MIPTPFWTYVYYHGEKWVKRRREGRMMFAHRSFLDAGIRSPARPTTAGPFEPLMAPEHGTRKDYKGRSGASQGDPRRGAGDHRQRRLRLVGRTPERSTRPASYDFVVLEKDPHDVDPDQIMKIKVNRTVVGGKTVYGDEQRSLTTAARCYLTITRPCACTSRRGCALIHTVRRPGGMSSSKS